MEIFIAFWTFALGCCVGSFLNVCIWRLPRGMGIHSPSRSLCPACEHELAWYDNIPLLSYALLRGRCRYCSEPISWRYPVVEAATGIVFAGIYVQQGLVHGTPPEQLIIMGLVAALLIVASGVDMTHFIVPDEISVFGIMAALLAGLLLPELHVGMQPYHTLSGLTGIAAVDGLIGSALGAVVGGGLVYLFAVVGSLMFGREALGLGDVKLMAMVGAFLGWKVAVFSFFLAPFFGLVYGIPLLLMKGQHLMPFGPFLSSAAVLVTIFRGAATGFLRPFERMILHILGL